jgi:hypothetical protein
MTPPPTSTPCAIQFSDVPPGSTYYEYVRCFACRGFISGYPDGTFRPNENITRGQLSKVVVNAALFQQPIPPDQQTFEDVPIGSTFWWYIEQLAVGGMVQGYPCGSPGEDCVPPENRPYFRPGQPTNRGQAAKVVDEAAGFASPCSDRAFEDITYADPLYCHVQHLYEHSAVSGYPCGGYGEPCVPPLNRPYFRPIINSTRGQLVKMASAALYPFPLCDTP